MQSSNASGLPNKAGTSAAVANRGPTSRVLERLGGFGRTAARPSQWPPTALLAAACLALLVYFAIDLRSTGFLSVSNINNVVAQATVITVMAVGNVFVLTSGEIDLSFANVAALSGVLLALLVPHIGIVGALVVALLGAAAVGLVNGIVAFKIGIPSFIVTLGTMQAVDGFTRWISGLRSLPVTNTAFTNVFGSWEMGSISVLIVWTIGAVLLGWWVLQRTAAGRRVQATGGSETAARYSGIRTSRVKIIVFVGNAVIAGVAGLLYVGQYHGASYQYVGNNLILTLSAVIIGGTALTGGKGSVVGALLGSLLLGFITNALVIKGLSVEAQEVLEGLIIVAAVTISGRKRIVRRVHNRDARNVAAADKT